MVPEISPESRIGSGDAQRIDAVPGRIGGWDGDQAAAGCPGAAEDDAAIEMLGQCFPGREMIPIDCRELVWGLGSIHCLTQQLPSL